MTAYDASEPSLLSDRGLPPCLNCPNCGHRLPASYWGPCVQCGAPGVTSAALGETVEKLRDALEAQESAELAWANCELCGGEGEWSHCPSCSLNFGRAIDKRRAGLSKVKDQV